MTDSPAADSDKGDIERALTTVFREESGRIVGALTRLCGDLDLAEECAQDAFASALENWRAEGLPPRPGAWLMVVARNRAFDRLRRGTTERTKLEHFLMLSENSGPQPGGGEIDDDQLRLVFTCCHLALATEAQIALTLRTVLGLTTAEIAHALLTSEPTMAQRLVRAKAKIKHSLIPFEVPDHARFSGRLAAVLHVVYLLFNEGYGAAGGALYLRAELCGEAIRLARLLAGLVPDEPELSGLLALLLLQHARRTTRVDAQGALVPLANQDRSRWDHALIDEGAHLVETALRQGHAGPYQLQAAIAACHATAGSMADTDWREILGLYDVLLAMTPSPVIALNRTVALAEVDGPKVALARLDALEASGQLAGYHLLRPPCRNASPIGPWRAGGRILCARAAPGRHGRRARIFDTEIVRVDRRLRSVLALTQTQGD
jgi:RNA polymerase sigma-70 factor, ECF subfamily